MAFSFFSIIKSKQKHATEKLYKDDSAKKELTEEMRVKEEEKGLIQEKENNMGASTSNKEPESSYSRMKRASEHALVPEKKDPFLNTPPEDIYLHVSEYLQADEDAKKAAVERELDLKAQDVINKLYPEKHIRMILESGEIEISSIDWELFPEQYIDNALKGRGLERRSTDRDELFVQAGKYIIEENKASIGYLQRMLKIGFNRAAEIMDQLTEAGVVSEESRTRARQVLMSMSEFEVYISEDLDGAIHIATEKKKKIRSDFRSAVKDEWGHSHYCFSYEIYRRAEIKLDNETKVFLANRFQIHEYKILRSSAAIENLKNHRNLIVTNSKFDTPLTFVLSAMMNYSPAQIKLILIDEKDYFNRFKDYYLLFNPHVKESYLIRILDWCIEERNKRQESTLYNGDFGYKPYPFSNELPIMIVVRELYNILQIKGVREKLLQLLVNSYQFGIYFVGFSQYGRQNIGVSTFRNMVEFMTEEEIFEILADEKKDQIIEEIDNHHNAKDSKPSKDTPDIDSMDGIDFEKYCATILKANRFTNITVTKSSGDYGADIIAVRDQIKYAIQCKRSVTPIGNKAVQEVIASRSVYNCHVGVVLTNNYFTNNARVLAKKNNILLWDRNELIKMCSLVKS